MLTDDVTGDMTSSPLRHQLERRSLVAEEDRNVPELLCTASRLLCGRLHGPDNDGIPGESLSRLWEGVLAACGGMGEENEERCVLSSSR